MELRQYLSVLRSRLWLILVTTIVAGVAGGLVSNTTPEYVARSTIYVGDRGGTVDTPAELSTDRLAALDRVVLTFSKMIDSEPIAEEAIGALDLDVDADDVVDATEVRPEPATQLLYIDVGDSDPAVAQALSNALADAFVESVLEFEPSETGTEEGSVPQLPAYVFQRASLPTEPVPTGQARTIVLATLFGLVVGTGLALLLDYLDVSLRSAADVERRLELPVLGVIPALGTDASFGRPSTRREPRDEARRP